MGFTAYIPVAKGFVLLHLVHNTVTSKSLLLDVMEPRRRRKCIARVAVIVQVGGLRWGVGDGKGGALGN